MFRLNQGGEVPLRDECYILADIFMLVFNLLDVLAIDHQKVDLRELGFGFDLSSDEPLNVFLYKLPRLDVYFFDGAMEFSFVLLSKVEWSRLKDVSLLDLFLLVHRILSGGFFSWASFLALLTLFSGLLLWLHLGFIWDLVIVYCI